MALLFSYGSNHPAQLAERLEHPVETRSAYVDNYARAFRGRSQRWGGGVATLIPQSGARTYGHAADVTPADLRVLDAREGVPASYTRTKLTVKVDGGTAVAWVYLARSAEVVPPSRPYLEAIAKTINAHWTGEGGRPVTWRDITVR